jgi:hypothetical protein
MSQGTIHVFSKYANLLPQGALAPLWGSDAIKFGIITSAVTPSITDSDPRWGAGGSQNYATNEVTPGGNYSAGGIALVSPVLTLSGAVTSAKATSPLSFASNPSNPIGCAWGIFYDSTEAGFHAFAFADLRDSLGADISTVAGFSFNLAGQLTGAQQVFTITAT